jgi:hypothetical protein
MEILDEFQKILNYENSYSLSNFYEPIHVHYSNQTFFIFRLEDWETYNHGISGKNIMTYVLLHRRILLKPVVKELFDLVDYCKNNISKNADYKDLICKIQKYSDFQDVLEVI